MYPDHASHRSWMHPCIPDRLGMSLCPDHWIYHSWRNPRTSNRLNHHNSLRHQVIHSWRNLRISFHLAKSKRPLRALYHPWKSPRISNRLVRSRFLGRWICHPWKSPRISNHLDQRNSPLRSAIHYGFLQHTHGRFLSFCLFSSWLDRTPAHSWYFPHQCRALLMWFLEAFAPKVLYQWTFHLARSRWKPFLRVKSWSPGRSFYRPWKNLRILLRSEMSQFPGHLAIRCWLLQRTHGHSLDFCLFANWLDQTLAHFCYQHHWCKEWWFLPENAELLHWRPTTQEGWSTDFLFFSSQVSEMVCPPHSTVTSDNPKRIYNKTVFHTCGQSIRFSEDLSTHINHKIAEP